MAWLRPAARLWRNGPFPVLSAVPGGLRFFAGHNKWSKIRHKKGAKDANRAKAFGKASKSITAASRACGGDLSNLRLQSAIAHAKSIQLPKDRIEDAVAKATSKSSGDNDLENLRFDAMMSFDGTKVACIITALTDNRKRAVQQVRTAVSKAGGDLLATNTHDYIFQYVGNILVEAVDDEDSLMLCAIEAGAIEIEALEQLPGEEEQDSQQSSASYVVTTEEKDLWHVVQNLQDNNFNVAQFEHSYSLIDTVHGFVQLSAEGSEKLDLFLEKLDDTDDVSQVFHNAQ